MKIHSIRFPECAAPGIYAIANERIRQVESHGFDELHDRQHTPEHLLRAAELYARAATGGTVEPWEWPWEGKKEPITGETWRQRCHYAACSGALASAGYDRMYGSDIKKEDA